MHSGLRSTIYSLSHILCISGTVVIVVVVAAAICSLCIVALNHHTQFIYAARQQDQPTKNTHTHTQTKTKQFFDSNSNEYEYSMLSEMYTWFLLKNISSEKTRRILTEAETETFQSVV